MNACFAFDDIIFIEIPNIQSICPVIQMHPIIKPGIRKSQSVHKIPALTIRHNTSRAVRLLYNNHKLMIFIATITQHLHCRIRENGIMDNDAI